MERSLCQSQSWIVTSVSLCGMRVAPVLCVMTGLEAKGFSWLRRERRRSLERREREREEELVHVFATRAD